MAWLKGFTYDGIDSLDYDLYITSGSVYDAPERVVDMIKVPGRNGNLAIDRGKFENIDVEYNVYTKDRSQTSFAQNIRDFRNELCSRHEYLRLTDDYNSDEFRLGIYKSGLELDADIDRAGAIKLTFDCKPQRFLTSGETERSIPEWFDMHTDSGNLVTIDNSSGEYVAKSLSAAIVPQQDLNGYDNPWAGGGGKNKLSNNVTNQTVNGITVTVSNDGVITCNGTATAQVAIVIGTFYGEQGVNYKISGMPSGSSTSKYFLNLAPSPETGVSDTNYYSETQITPVRDLTITARLYIRNGQTVSNLVFKPMIRLASDTDATYEPYENICPITGFDSVKLYLSGKNLARNENVVGSITKYGLTFTKNSDGSVTVNGTNTRGSTVNYFFNLGADQSYYLDMTLPVGQYVLTGCPTGGATNKYFIGMYHHNNVSQNWGTSLDIGSGKTYTVTADTNTGIGFRIGIASGQTVSNLTFKPMLRLASVADATYEPYKGNTYSVSFGSAGTVYGGTLDVVSGQLTVERAFITLDETANWSWSTATLRPHVLISGMEIKGAVISNMYPYSSSNVAVDGTITTNAGSGNDVWIYDTVNAPDLNSWKTFVASNNLQVVYTLATPLTYQLTATQVAFLLGTNNIWSNTGDISIEYGKGGNTLFNPTLFDSRPLIELTGAGTLGINNYIITITGSGKLYIDCDTMEAYTITGGIVTSANNRVSLNTTDYPVLRSGINSFAVGTGISNVKITPRWWRV